ncbi:unnamed protein product, partial [Rotaria sp. Silwood2]
VLHRLSVHEHDHSHLRFACVNLFNDSFINGGSLVLIVIQKTVQD